MTTQREARAHYEPVREHLCKLELRDRAGYAQKPQDSDEASYWEAEVVWPSDDESEAI